jgi:methylenetetrahydrofolate--tRNA-(uracil-5-)-methyltransferase
MAERGEKTLAFGPMKPVGLTDPRTGKRPHAVVQLRAEDKGATAYNLVGFQTRMKWPEQKRIFRMIPGLESAEFVRLGSVHRNTFVEAPRALDDELAIRGAPGVHLAGQITGVEGYVESAACGLVLGVVLAQKANGEEVALPPATTALGALYRYTRTPREGYQPSNVVWSMFPELDPAEAPKKKRGKRADKKRAKHEAMAERALRDLAPWVERIGAKAVHDPHVHVEREAREAERVAP